MLRIAVIGTTGSGKTTLASRIADRAGVPHVELDALHWGPDWTPVPLEVFRSRVTQALSGRRWVTDGNYGKVRDIVWRRADTVVWLDYGLGVVLTRLAGRTCRRIFTREELWSGNRERLWTQLFTRDSLFLWALRTYRKRRREYPELLMRAEHVHLQAIRLRSPSEATTWLSNLTEEQL
jgi:adenylate kinase family enzyme